MVAFYFFYAMNVCIIPVINNKVKQGEGLVQRHFIAGGFAASYTIYNVRLKTKQFCENANDDRSLPEPGESENNTSCFMNHGNCLKLKCSFKH